MNAKFVKRLLVLLLALCLTLLPLFASVADESGEPAAAPAAEEAPKEESAKKEEPKAEAPKEEAPKEEPPKEEPPKEEAPKEEPPKEEPPKEEPPKEEPPKEDAPQEEPTDEPAQEPSDEPTSEPTQGGDGETPAPETTADGGTQAPQATPEQSAEASATPEAEHPVVSEISVPLAVLNANISGGVYTVNADMKVADMLKDIEDAKKQNPPQTVSSIKVAKGRTLSGEGVVNLPVVNEGTISGGTYSAQVTNGEGSTISGGTYSGQVVNSAYAKISNGTFSGQVTNEKDGKIEEGTFTETSVLTNRGEVISRNEVKDNKVTILGRVTIEGKFIVESGSKANYCKYGKKATIQKDPESTGTITVPVHYETSTYYKQYGDPVRAGMNTTAANKHKDEYAADPSKDPAQNPNLRWYSYLYGEDENTKVPVADGATFDLPEKVYLLEDGYVYVVSGAMNAADVLKAISDAASQSPAVAYTKILILEGATLNGTDDNKITLPVDNSGTISGGNFSAAVNNDENASIIGGTFNGAVTNGKGASISDGTFSAAVTNGANGVISGGIFSAAVTNEANGSISGGTFSATVTNKASGKITGGQFAEGATLDNSGTVQGATIDGLIIAEKGSKATECTFGKAKADKKSGGSITVYYYLNDKNTKKSVEYGTGISKTLGSAGSGYTWHRYTLSQKKGDSSAVSANATFGLKEYIYYKHKNKNSSSSSSGGSSNSTAKPTTKPTTNPTVKPTVKPTIKPTGDEAGGYSWESSVTGSDGEVEGEDGEFGIREELTEYYLRDGDSEQVDILEDDAGAEADYELITISSDYIDEEEEETDDAADESDGEEPEEVVDAEEDAEYAEVDDSEDDSAAYDGGRIPGELDEDGLLPSMLFIRAKGMGTEGRKLTLTLSQIQRIMDEQEVEVLLFRNGATTVSLDLSELFEGDVPKLMDLMRSWRDNDVDFSEYDIDTIDFSAVDTEPEFTEEDLREFKLELSIIPAMPVGYSIRADLFLGEESKEISGMLANLGITLHADTVTQEVAVYYLNDDEQRYMLDTHHGRVPDVEDRVEGYDVSFAEDGESTVSALDRSVSEDEFAGLCATAGGAGTYYVGILPNASTAVEGAQEV